VLAALVERATSGQGQVIDAAIVDGVSHLMANPYSLLAGGAWNDERGTNLIDSGAPFVDIYRTRDNRYVTVAALEPPFYAAFVEGLGLSGEDLPAQWDTDGWPTLRERFAAAIATRDRDEWTETFAGTDACVSPVLSMREAPYDEHLRARCTFVVRGGRPEPAPAPRFNRTPSVLPSAPLRAGATDRTDVLRSWGIRTTHHPFTPTPSSAPPGTTDRK
jgi:alpha-methylacyl-CoA racemase